MSVSQYKWLAPANITLPGGHTQAKSYDGLLNLEALKVKTAGQQTVLDLQNSYGKEQELTQSKRTDTAANISTSKTSTYVYDTETRLTQAKTDAGGLFGTDTQTFTLDGLANRTAHSRTSGAWTYDANNRLTQRGTGTCGTGNINSSTTCYQYDDAGNLTQKTEAGKVTQYSYDTQNRLTEVADTTAGQSATQRKTIAKYGYDPLGRRIWKEQYRDSTATPLAQAKRTIYLYADEGLIAEATQAITVATDASGVQTVTASTAPAISTQYGPTPNSPFGTGALFIKTKNSNNTDTIAYYHHDHLQTPIQATDKAGNIVWAASYDAFGKASIITPAATADKPTVESNLRLPGQYEDQETGLHYNYFRYMDTQTGRYITQDPIGLAGGVNRFAYVNGNPINLMDPMGLYGTAYGFYAHMNSGARVFGRELTFVERVIIMRGQTWADNKQHQGDEYSFMHAMSNSSNTPQQACKASNEYLQQIATLAIEAKNAGKRNESLFLFSVALHTMQDSASPAHRGFQEWNPPSGYWGIPKFFYGMEHFLHEWKDPGAGSDLDRMTQKAWTSFKNGNKGGFKMDCSCEQ